MDYYFSKMLNASFDEAVQRITEALKPEGFGIISEINIHEKLNEKLGIDFTLKHSESHPLNEA